MGGLVGDIYSRVNPSASLGCYILKDWSANSETNTISLLIFCAAMEQSVVIFLVRVNLFHHVMNLNDIEFKYTTIFSMIYS